MNYDEIMRLKYAELREKTEEPVILAIESSCDETAAAVYKGRQKLSSVISSQIEIHRLFGGVVPEIAARNHAEAVANVVKLALEEAGLTLDGIDCFAVTYGAGLIGALLVGVSYAKGLSLKEGKPLIAVNHIQGHIAANYILHEELAPPYICLVASGGHTALVKVNAYTDFEILGRTGDDACGEAFDKVARLLGLPYPGGPSIEKLAKEGRNILPLPKVRLKNKLDFSYSGLKTAVINLVHKLQQKGEEIPKADIALSFQQEAVAMLADNAILAVKQSGYKKLALAGGVGANKALRQLVEKEAKELGITTYFPTGILCTDNADMIAMAANKLFHEGRGLARQSLDANASLDITDIYE